MPVSVQTILYIAHLYVEYVFTAVFILGLTGNFGNIVIFISLRKFRQCPAAFYLTAGSIASAGVLLIGLMPRIVVEISGFDPARALLIWCKLRIPLSQWCTLTGLSAINFAAFDQYLSTSCDASLRELSTNQLAKYLISIASVVWFLYNIPFFIFYDIQVSFGCLLKSPGLSRYYSYFHLLVLYGLLPLLFTTTCSILAYRNVRRIRRLQMSNIRRRLDHQLTAMILAHVAFLVLCLVPFIVQRFYTINVQTDPKNVFRIAIEQLVGAINISLSYLNVSGSFYVYLLASARFRRQAKYVLRKKLWRRCRAVISGQRLCSNNRVVPVSDADDNRSDV